MGTERNEQCDRQTSGTVLEKGETSPHLESILEGATIGILALDRKWRFTFINGHACGILGKHRGEHIGRGVWDIYPGLLGTVFEKKFREAMEERRSVPFEAHSPPGQWISAYAYPIEEGIAVQFIDSTGRKKVEAALRRSEKNLTEAQRIGHIGSWEWDMRNGEEHWSAEQYAIFGVDPSTFVPNVNSYMRLVHPDDRDRLNGIIQQVQASGKPIQYDFRIVMPDGSVHVMQSTAEVIEWDENGKPVYMIGINQDVTDRKRAEDALHASEEKYRTLVETSPDGVTYTDMDARIIYANGKTAELHGYGHEELIGMNVYSLVAPADRDRVKGNLERTIATGVAESMEYTLLRKDGSSFPAELSARAVIDKNGNPTGFVGITRDITERKKEEAQLRRNEYEIRTLVDNSPDLIFRVDSRLRYVFVNHAYESLTGIQKERFIGRTNRSLGMASELTEFWEKAIRKAIEGGQESTVDFNFSGLFGKRHFSARLIPEFAKSGLVETVLVIGRDITERS